MKNWLNKCHFGDCLETLRLMPAGIVNTCVTSPPYFGLRDYGHDGQIGLEATPDEFVAKLVAVFREVRRVLRDDGTCWINIGDSYAAQRGGSLQPAETLAGGVGGKTTDGESVNRGRSAGYNPTRNASSIGVKHKDLIGIPWLLAFALRADGWYLRQEIIWHKPNPMPESVTDRCTKSHESIFLLSKSEKYYFDAGAIKEPCETADPKSISYRENGKSDSRKKHSIYCKDCDGSGDEDGSDGDDCHTCGGSGLAHIGRAKTAVKNNGVWNPPDSGRNKRSVWTVATKPYSGAHFACFPPALIEPCILAGAPAGGVVLDPFGGSGTTAQTAQNLGRKWILCELNEAYKPLIDERVAQPSLEFA